MQGLDQDIKTGDFRKVYLLFGEEEYLKNHYKNRLVDAMGGKEDAMNFAAFEGKDINPGAVIDLAETMPFFKDYRVILIENSGFFKNACDELAAYIKEGSETTYFIFVESEVDKRGKMYKAVTAAGRAVELVSPKQEVLIKWAYGILKRNGKLVRQSTLEYLIDRCGTDMNTLERELNKLVDYIGDREAVENADVDAICSVEIKNQIFEMIDAMASGKAKRALDLYYDLLTLKEPPLRILALIGRQFNLLLQIKELTRHTRDQKLLGERTGLNPFIARKYADNSRRFSQETLRMALEECVVLEEDVETGKLADKLSVELLIIKYSNGVDVKGSR